MQLDAIAEIHPLNIVHTTCDANYFGERISDRIWLGYFGALLKRSPEALTQDSFWNSIDALITTEGRAYNSNKEQSIFDARYSQAQFNEIIDLAMGGLRIARQILAAESEVLQRGNYKILYTEGVEGHPLHSIANAKKIKAAYLDSGVQAYDLLIDEPFQYTDHQKFLLHSEREECWLQKIDPQKRGLLVLGAEHAKDSYGLIKKLGTKGIGLVVVQSFEHYGKDMKVLCARFNEIKNAALESFFD